MPILLKLLKIDREDVAVPEYIAQARRAGWALHFDARAYRYFEQDSGRSRQGAAGMFFELDRPQAFYKPDADRLSWFAHVGYDNNSLRLDA
jgi:hypothetical protein